MGEVVDILHSRRLKIPSVEPSNQGVQDYSN